MKRRRPTFPLTRGLFQTGLDWAYVWLRQGERFVRHDSPERYRYPADADSAKAPIIVIPGIYEPWQFMRPLIRLLHAWKHPIHIIEGLGYNVGDVPHMAEQVRQFIDTRDIRGAVIIAHSKGGLIGKYLLAQYNENHNEDDRIRHVVTLNTPFVGSIYATLAPVRNIRAFSPADRLIKELDANRDINHRITSIYYRVDPSIPEGSALDGATNIEVDGIGHFRIVNDPAAHRAILDTLVRCR